MKIMDMFRKLIITHFQVYGDHKIYSPYQATTESKRGNLLETQNMNNPTML